MSRSVRTIALTAIAAASMLVGPVPLTQAAAPREAPAGDAVRVATFNVMKSTGAKGRWSWAKRRKKMVRAVASASPDVLLVQEANTQKWRSRRHIEDVAGLLAGIGYRIASTDYDSCTAGCTRGAHIFYNPSRMAPVAPPTGLPAAGMLGISQIAAVDFGGTQDRNAAWAFLAPRGSARTTLYVSVHLPSLKTAHEEALRVAVASQLRPWANSLIASSGLPSVELVIGGDLNSYQARQPNGAQQILANAGLVDAWAAPVRVNANFGTVNYTPKTRKYKGFPPRPYFYKYEPTRIDYVFSSVLPQRHEVVLNLTKKGKFRNKFRASDHNMVMVDLPLR